MFFVSLPIEIITHIFDLLDESGPRKPYDFEKHRKMCKKLMALRLTCKELEEIAKRQLFRTFYLLPSLKSWVKLHTIANSRKFQGHLKILALERLNASSESTYKLMVKNVSKTSLPLGDDNSRFDAWDRSIYEMRNKIPPETPLPFSLDLALLPNLKVLRAEDKWS